MDCKGSAFAGVRRQGLRPGSLAVAYALLGLLAVTTLARVVPPFQNPDELAQVLRAEQVGLGGLLARRFDGPLGRTAGGWLDGGADALYAVFEPLVFHPEVRATAGMFDRAAGIGWGGTRRWQHFENTGVYPPVLYLPAAAAIALGRRQGAPVLRTLHAARLAGGVVAVGLGALAVGLGAAAAPWLFAVLALPMSLSLMASVSQDALLLPVAALAAALLVRLRGPEPDRPAHPHRRWRFPPPAGFAALCLCLALVATARPAYLPTALLPLAARVRWRWRLAGAAAVAGCVLGWSALAADVALVGGGDGGLADPAAQAALLRAEPTRVWQVGAATLQVHGWALAEGFVGRLGWLDLALPAWLRRVGVATLLLGALASAAPVAANMQARNPSAEPAASPAPRPPTGRGRTLAVLLHAGLRHDWGRALAVLVAGASVVALAALLYLTWTAVGLGVVMGLQGRYFLPVALLLAPALPRRPILSAQTALALPFGAAFMMAGVTWEVVARYYLR